MIWNDTLRDDCAVTFYERDLQATGRILKSRRKTNRALLSHECIEALLYRVARRT